MALSASTWQVIFSAGYLVYRAIQNTSMNRPIFLIFLCVFHVAVCAAATIEVKNGELTIGGVMVPDDLERFRDIFARNTLKVVKFDSCTGGDVATGYELSKMIRQRKLKTIARHQTHSSCAYAYLAGTPRVFSSEYGMHAIMLHAARNVDPRNDVASKINPALRRYLIYLTEGKLTTNIVDLIENSKELMQGVVFVSYKYPFISLSNVFYCNGSEGGDLYKCVVLKDADSLTLGIITSD